MLKRFFSRKRNVAVTAVVGACLLALIAGVIMDICLHNNGTIGDAEFKHRMIFILNTVGSMAIVFAVELIFRVRFPAFMEIAVTVFAFAATGLATVYGFYELIYEWDTVLHTVSGVMFAIVGMSVASLVFSDKLAGTRKTVAYVLTALLFALAIGYIWEIFEYTLDSITHSDLQPYDVSLMKDASGAFQTVEIDGQIWYYTNSVRGSGLIDTLVDMIVNLIGALVFCIPMLVVAIKKPENLHLFDVEYGAFWKKRMKGADGETPADPSDETVG